MNALLEVEGVTKTYGSLVALRDVTFSLRNREIVGLIGPNGAGKTTLIGVLSGAIVPTAGSVSFCGRALIGERPYRIGELGIARTFQLVQPFQHLTARECVMLGAMFGATEGRNVSVRAARERAEVLLAMVGLRDKADSLSESLNVPERKRLEIARVMAARPKLLLLDEVMAGLSSHEIAEVVKIVRQLRDDGITIIVIFLSASFARRFGKKGVAIFPIATPTLLSDSQPIYRILSFTVFATLPLIETTTSTNPVTPAGI